MCVGGEGAGYVVKDVKFEACKMDTYAEKLIIIMNHEYMYISIYH